MPKRPATGTGRWVAIPTLRPYKEAILEVMRRTPGLQDAGLIYLPSSGAYPAPARGKPVVVQPAPQDRMGLETYVVVSELTEQEPYDPDKKVREAALAFAGSGLGIVLIGAALAGGAVPVGAASMFWWALGTWSALLGLATNGLNLSCAVYAKQNELVIEDNPNAANWAMGLDALGLLSIGGGVAPLLRGPGLRDITRRGLPSLVGDVRSKLRAHGPRSWALDLNKWGNRKYPDLQARIQHLSEAQRRMLRDRLRDANQRGEIKCSSRELNEALNALLRPDRPSLKRVFCSEKVQKIIFETFQKDLEDVFSMGNIAGVAGSVMADGNVLNAGVAGAGSQVPSCFITGIDSSNLLEFENGGGTSRICWFVIQRKPRVQGMLRVRDRKLLIHDGK